MNIQLNKGQIVKFSKIYLGAQILTEEAYNVKEVNKFFILLEDAETYIKTFIATNGLKECELKVIN